MNDKMFVPLRQACSITGIEEQTLRKLADQEILPCYKTPSGHRMFNKAGLEAMCNANSISNRERTRIKLNYIYARVSSKKQLDDLSRQIEYIRSRKPEYASYTVISDVGSGINFKRKGLNTILDACLQNVIGEVIVAHRDRLSRFGFDLIDIIVSKSGGKINVINDERDKSSEQELSEDLLSIIHIFSCRQMGKRSYKTKSDKISKN
jgi:predicted site-specific integrase-resolvase